MPTNTLPKTGRVLLLFLVPVLLLFACKGEEPTIPVVGVPVKGSFVFVCDDWDVDNWYAFRDTFLKYDVKVTFYVSHYHQMDAVKRNKLKTLRDDGHEIAYHTLNHPWVDSTYSESDIRHYVELELDSGMALMAADGFTLRSFAFPGGFSIPPLIDSAKARFATVRTYNFGFHEYWKQSRKYQLRADDPARTLIPYGIDKASGFLNLAQWDLIMKDIYAGRSVSLLFHSIDDRNPYSTHPPWFMQIIREIHSQKIACKTVGEFFGY